MKEFNLLRDVPYIHNTDELAEFLKPLYIISDYMVDEVTYGMFRDKLLNLVRGSFTIRECREYPIKFKFYKTDKETHELQFRHFYVNVILWAAFVDLNDVEVMNKDMILDCFNNIPNINDYINDVIIGVLRDYHIKATKINYNISEVLHKLRKISEDFSIIMNLQFSAPMFIDLYNRIPEMRDMMECTFDSSMQPHEIEQVLNQYENREIELLENDPGNHLGVVLRAGTGIKHKQLREFTISEGLKPTIDGKTITKPIENSTMLRGLDRPSYMYIDATGARKSLIMNKKVMGRAGYFGKILLMLARTLSVSTTVSDCNTKHLVTYDVRDKRVLKKLNGKYYKINDSDDLKLLNAKKDKDLIGKKIKVRSAATCACGNQVCPRCVGYTSVINSDISDGLSAFESEEVSKVVNQSILSTKHLLTTNSEVITFNPPFYRFFTITGGEISPFINDNESVENLDNYAIYIDPEDKRKIDEMDDDGLYNTVIYNGRFYITNLNDKDDIIEIQCEGEKEIFLSDTAIELMNKGKGLIKFKDLNDGDTLFEMNIMNNELTKPLYGIMNLLNKENKDEIDETIDSISQKFLDLLIESKIDANVIACELIINRLIVAAKDKYRRPDFSDEELEDYEIITVSKALTNNKSPLIGISFQNIKRQFLSDELFEERDGTAYIDEFYRKEVSTANLKKYSKIVRADRKFVKRR